MKNWLSLSDYAAHYDISITTLRRRIRENSIPYEVRDGKYFVADGQIGLSARGRKLIPMSQGNPDEFAEKEFLPSNQDLMIQALVDDLKKAYAQILTDKQDQIEQLKEEISDLRTLTRVLESELERVKMRAPEIEF